MTREQTPTSNQGQVPNLWRTAADGCGGALNSLVVVLADRCGLYATGQYSFDVEEPIVCRKAPRITQKRNSIKAADGLALAHDGATPGEDRGMSVQREETAFMTLMYHECAVAPDWHLGTRGNPQG